jgi:hypothetical protein
MNKETKIQRQIMLDLSQAGHMVFRNETVGAYVGQVIHKSGDQVTLARAIFMRLGLAIGSCDLIGITPSGRFFGIEVKTAKGRASKEQKVFIDAINKQGGIAGIARTSEEALTLLQE